MLAAGGLFAAVEAIKGGIGYEDVKLAGIIGAAIAGHSITGLWIGLIAGSILAVIWAKTTNRVPKTIRAYLRSDGRTLTRHCPVTPPFGASIPT